MTVMMLSGVEGVGFRVMICVDEGAILSNSV